MKNQNNVKNTANKHDDQWTNPWYDQDDKLGDLVDTNELASSDDVNNKLKPGDYIPAEAIHEAAEAEANGELPRRATLDKIGEIATKGTLGLNVAALDETADGQFQLPSSEE